MYLQNTDSRIIVSLEAVTYNSGSYINSEYNLPEDYRMSQIDREVDRVGLVEIESEFITNKKIVSTYEDVIEHFSEGEGKYFVTGITDSKADLISKFFSKTNMGLINQGVGGFDDSKFKVISGDENNGLQEVSKDFSSSTTIRIKHKFEIPNLDSSGMILLEDNDSVLEYVLYLDTPNPIKYIDLGGGISRFVYLRSHDENYNEANMILYDSIIDEPKITSDVFIDRGYNSAFDKVKRLKNISGLKDLISYGFGFYKINTKGYDFKNNQ